MDPIKGRVGGQGLSWEKDPVTSLDLENSASLVTSPHPWDSSRVCKEEQGEDLSQLCLSQLRVQSRAGRKGMTLLAAGTTKAAPHPGPWLPPALPHRSLHVTAKC